MKMRSFFEMCGRSYEYLNIMCNQISKEYSDITFSVIQCDPNFRTPLEIVSLIKEISYFYNDNWLGNADYLHVPDEKKVLDNYMKYPTVMAYRYDEAGNIEILGLATLKYYQNDEQQINPYYPLPHKRFFEITGILTKRNNDIKNIGKKIYEILIEALREYKNILPDFDIVFVADCRNYMSINGARGGAKYLREQHHKEAFGNIIGVYTVRENGRLTEAPTFVAKFEFSQISTTNPTVFSYQNDEDLFESMLATIVNKLNNRLKNGIKNMDECGEVTFYEIDNECINLDDVTIIPNGTDLGNNRIPQIRRERIKAGY